MKTTLLSFCKGCMFLTAMFFFFSAKAQTGCQASFVVNQPFNFLTVNFTSTSTSTSTITSWYWTFGDNNSSTLQNPTHVYAAAGTYNVCLTITDAHGCSTHMCHPVVCHHPVIHHPHHDSIAAHPVHHDTIHHPHHPHHPHHRADYVKPYDSDMAEELFPVSIFPNPASSFAIVEYELAEPLTVTIELFDARGLRATRSESGNKAAGRHSLRLSAEGLEAGFYFVKLTAGAKSFTGKIAVIR